MSGGGQGRLVGGWAGGCPPPPAPVPCGARPGSGPQALPVGPGRESGQRKCPWQNATTRGSSCPRGQHSPCLGSASTFGWVPQPGPQTSVPCCPLFPTGPALGLPPTEPYSFIQLRTRELLEHPKAPLGHGGRSSKQTCLVPWSAHSLTFNGSPVPSRMRRIPKHALEAVNSWCELPSLDSSPIPALQSSGPAAQSMCHAHAQALLRASAHAIPSTGRTIPSPLPHPTSTLLSGGLLIPSTGYKL